MSSHDLCNDVLFTHVLFLFILNHGIYVLVEFFF